MIDLSKKPAQKRALKILNWLELYVNAVRPISKTELYGIFGNTSRQPGKALKELFLEVADPYYNMNTSTCIKYRRNKKGINWVKQQLGITNFVPELTAEQEHQLDTGEFEYKDNGKRIWCNFQFIQKTIRNPLLKSKGYNWDYDIEAAAPTLLYQYSQRLYQKQWLALSQSKKLRRPHFFIANNIELLITDKSSVRQQIAQDCGCTIDDVKKTINALFQGGVLTTYRDSKLFQELECDYRKISALKANRFLCEMRKEISKMWKIIKEELPVRYITDKNGVTKRRSLRGGDKSQVYLGIEREIAEVIRDYLKQTNNKHLWIHDGWCCSKRIYSDELITEVRRKTGYLIKLTERVIEN
jgi:hypothetical protein